MSSQLPKEDQETLRLLVQHVLRAFYEPKYTVVMDQLVRHPVLKDDDLAGRMGLQLKELNKVMVVLENDRLIKVHRQNELKDGAQRSVGRQYYYIDYQQFCNVVKWRVAEMHRRIDSNLRNQLDNKGYICPQCGKLFSPLEVDKLIDFASGTFVCDICQGELVDNENAENVVGSQDRMQRFNRQMRFILEGLRKTEDMVLPAFDVAIWVKKNIEAERAKATAQSGGLKIAGSSGDGGQGDTIGVVMSVDKDEATQRAERDREAATKRMQNVLPAWHLKSTISGDLTALGIRENARAEQQAEVDANRLPSSNDAILRGLTKPEPQPVVRNIDQDVKPAVTQMNDVNYYDQYYASLAASNVTSAQDTPALTNLDEFGEDDEDVKPNVEYLDSLNEYRKRSRSTEDIGVDRGPSKTPKLNGHTPSNGFTPSVPEPEPELPITSADEPAPEGLVDDSIVYVNGEAMKFSEVTEEHQELMTPEEYTAYYEVLSRS
ncbi:TFIIE alpha subunit-domain-containing protein [Phanerochaete sordida]|uniref:TFIIE alpha subunit-domain-containing protein n=1 Tax=Phanerochaete sordida TaxID=48140 RepID=A0A9P3FY25_9APHY|nr:TFIIE alpha subunit-domain-containing protein [Phanerochaete sordida]